MRGITADLGPRIVKPLASATLFRRARRRLHDEILDALAGCRTIVDVAAGDDPLYLKLAARPDVARVVLNDLDLEALRRGARPHPKVVRISADALSLDFLRHRFDAALVKNVLHHLADREAIHRLLGMARRLARRVVVVEIENPEAARVPRLLHHHHYYRRVMGERDNEELFFEHEELSAIVARAYPGICPIARRIRTVRGTYSLYRLDFAPDKEARS
jgi:ubiquinone/menaquinone biosynthesis C-methylase UbiE